MPPKLEPDDTIQTLLKKWMLFCNEHQSPSIAMQGEWMICPSCAIHFAQQSVIIYVRNVELG